MKLILSIIVIAIFSAIAECFLPWWGIAVVCFPVSLLIKQKAGRAFVAGFLGIAAFWFIAILIRDIPNAHLLSTRMASVLPLKGHYPLFIAVTLLIGGLVGGLASWAGSLMRG